MGLDVSHDAFHGAYSAFNRLRQAVMHALGGSFPPHWEYNNDGSIKERGGRSVYKPDMEEEFIYYPDDFSKEENPGLHEFLTHSDCDGEISPEMCVLVADGLDAILPRVEALGWEAHGHLARYGSFAGALRQFIKGARAAAANGEPLDFH